MRLSRFLLGLPFLLAPLSVSAAIDCAQLRDARAIATHYVQPALDRADRGIAYAAEAATNDDFSFYLPGWAARIGGAFARIVDSRQTLTLRASDLRTTTACLRYDQILLECKMDAVRTALDASFARGSFLALIRLQSVLLFLQERLQNLEQGSVDSGVVDTQWQRPWLFDKEPPPATDGPLCPFHSDYTPPRMTGYGCDSSVLQSLISENPDGALSFAEAELQGLTAIEHEIATFRDITPLLRSLSSPAEVAPPEEAPRHKTLVGCLERTGVCSDDSALACGSDEFCASKEKGQCLREGATPTLPKRALRGPFSYPRDHMQILTDFMEKRVADGLSRTFPANWTQADPLPDDAPAPPGTDGGMLQGIARTGLRLFFRSISAVQGEREGAVFPEAQDSQLDIAASLSDMRTAIGELSRLASAKDGMRAFVLDFAYFLRRTCAFRPCQQSLEQIIRISLEDACFPYTDGTFLTDTPTNPRWKQCAEAACIRVDGADLPSSCQEILP